MNKQVYDSLNYEYEKKRLKVHSELEEKRQEILDSHPSLKEVEEQIKKEGLSALKNIIQKGVPESDELIRKLEAKISSLKQKRRELIKEYNISDSALSPVYECSHCRDMGYTDSGKMCSCYKQKLIDLAYRQKHLELTSIENFETFNSELYSPDSDKGKYGTEISPRDNILKVKDFCFSFINDFNSPERKNLMLIGEPGRGKTFLSNCIAKELINQGKAVIYQTSSKLLDLVIDYKMRFQRPDNFNENEYEELFKVDLLIIDDLGTETHNNTRFSELFDIINTRLLTQRSENTKTILSTNLSLERFREYYDQRIVSRILGEFDIIKIYGDDIRIKKRC